jgi:hypothetical protein
LVPKWHSFKRIIDALPGEPLATGCDRYSINAPSSRAQVPDSNRVFGVETDSGVEPFAVEGVFDSGQRAV